MRVAIASGIFYERDFERLNSQIEMAFESGPGATPIEAKNRNVRAVIVPNLSYNLVAHISSWAYKELAESSQPSVFVVLGSLSKKSDKIALSLKDFSMPFGIVKNDRSLVNKLLDSNSLIDEDSHNKETSIELQLPFLQYISKRNLDSLKILPILTSTLNENLIRNLADRLAKIDNAVFVVSSNLLHYGPLYNFVPFRYNIEKELENLSNKILETTLNINIRDLLSITNRYDIPFISPIAVLLEVLRLKNIRRGDVLSQELIKRDEKNIISVASIIYNEVKD